jgi:tungstate transport system permease protein
VLETSKGNLPMALGLGIILLALVTMINAIAHMIGETAKRRLG